MMLVGIFFSVLLIAPYLVFCAVVFRIACYLTKWLIHEPPVEDSIDTTISVNNTICPLDQTNPFAPPSSYPTTFTVNDDVLSPTFERSLKIVTFANVIAFPFAAILPWARFWLDLETEISFEWLTLFLLANHFGILFLISRFQLPTTWVRAALISMFFFMICFFIAVPLTVF